MVFKKEELVISVIKKYFRKIDMQMRIFKNKKFSKKELTVVRFRKYINRAINR